MEEILYEYEGNLYVNLTNRCPCSCTFCIRSQQDGLGTADSLWLDHDPSLDEVLAAFDGVELKGVLRATGLTEAGAASETTSVTSEFSAFVCTAARDESPEVHSIATFLSGAPPAIDEGSRIFAVLPVILKNRFSVRAHSGTPWRSAHS